MTAVRPEVSSKKIAATASALSKQESDRLHVVLDDGSVVWDEAAKEILHLRATLDRTVTARDAYDIATFCVRHSISVPMYYKLRSKTPPETPVEFELGTRVLISRESAARWRRQRGLATAAKRERETANAAEAEAEAQLE